MIAVLVGVPNESKPGAHPEPAAPLRRPAVVEDKPSFDDWLDLILAVEVVKTIADMGISSIITLRLHATCSAHGGFTEIVDVDESKPTEHIDCPAHYVVYGVKHHCPIEAFEPVRYEP